MFLHHLHFSQSVSHSHIG